MHLWNSKRYTACFFLQKSCFITLTHNHIRNETAELLSQVTKEVKIEQVLQSVTGETFEQRTANTSDDALLDINTRRFGILWRKDLWSKHQEV